MQDRETRKLRKESWGAYTWTSITWTHPYMNAQVGGGKLPNREKYKKANLREPQAIFDLYKRPQKHGKPNKS